MATVDFNKLLSDIAQLDSQQLNTLKKRVDFLASAGKVLGEKEELFYEAVEESLNKIAISCAPTRAFCRNARSLALLEAALAATDVYLNRHYPESLTKTERRALYQILARHVINEVSSHGLKVSMKTTLSLFQGIDSIMENAFPEYAANDMMFKVLDKILHPNG